MRVVAAILIVLAGTAMARAEDAPLEVHGQATYLRQWKPSFHSPYDGPNSLSGASAASYSFTGTMFLGARLGDGWEAYFNPEFTQGVPFSGLKGVGGFT
ncbi:MAG TPA: carbohydrate porin, partial [Burkholderiales bacterium]